MPYKVRIFLLAWVREGATVVCRWPGSNFVDEINKYSLYFLILAIICGFTSVLETVLPIVVAARQVATIRTKCA